MKTDKYRLTSDDLLKLTQNAEFILGIQTAVLSKVLPDLEAAEKELNIVHECLTELYNIDAAIPIIKKHLAKIAPPPAEG